MFRTLIKLAVDGAFGSYSEASGGRLASLAYTHPPLAALAPQRGKLKNRKIFLKNKFLLKKKTEAENFWRKKLENKTRETFFEIFFLPIFQKKNSVEIFHMMRKLRMQIFPIIG